MPNSNKYIGLKTFMLVLSVFLIGCTPCQIAFAQTESISTNQTTDIEDVKLWFQKYDDIRKKPKHTGHEMFHLLTKACIPFADCSKEVVASLEREITYNQTSIHQLEALPLLSSTKELKDAWIDYLNAISQDFSNTVNAYKNRKTDHAQWKKYIDDSRRNGKKEKMHIEILRNKANSLDSELRTKYGIKLIDKSFSVYGAFQEN
jgi:hypothetical protein